jgi:hypothetical protein
MVVVNPVELVNHYYSESFTYEVGKTPLSNFYIIFIGIVLYLVGTIFLMRLKMQLNLTYFKCVHNLFLSVFSLVMFCGTMFEVFTLIAMHGTGPFELICDSHHQYNKGRLYFWIWLFHLSKWYEFLDTAILVLEGKKRLEFLHVYHHVLTLFVTWYGCTTHATCQWVGVALNTCVHTFMYYYYAMSTIGVSVSWKRQLTQAQMLQFVINMSSMLFLWIPYNQTHTCSGDFYTIALTFFANLTFFYLFWRFYKKTYIDPFPRATERDD